MKKQKKKKPAEPEILPEENGVDEGAPGAAGTEGNDDSPSSEDDEGNVSTPTVEEITGERDDLADRLLRLQADFENFKKRTRRERSELVRRAAEELMTELLPILDHFELGFENASNHEANPAVVEGFRIVYDQMLSGLRKHGLEPIDSVGQPFDPHLHEAITYLPSDEYVADSVIQQTRRGYLLGDRLLRAAQVVVSSGPAPEAQGVASVNEEKSGDGKDES